MNCIILPTLLPKEYSIEKLNRSEVRLHKLINKILLITNDKNHKDIYKEVFVYIRRTKYRRIFVTKYLKYLDTQFPQVNTSYITLSNESFKSNLVGKKKRLLSGIYNFKISQTYNDISSIYGNAKGNPKTIFNLPRE